MATEIKRVRFFDGQFLKQVDFRDEQRYHQHLRRRMNFLLFGGSGVMVIKAEDLRVDLVSAAAKTFMVHAGMAIGRNETESEGREVVLPVDTAPLDLATMGIGAGQTAVIALHFEEEPAKDPPSEGDVDEDTRVKEKAVLTAHALPGGPPAATPEGDPFITLGTIVFDTMSVSDTRPFAHLRAELIGAVAVPAPVITGVGGTISTPPGASVTFIVNGNNLTGGAVAFTDPALTVTPISSSAGSITVTVNVSGAAVPGQKAFSVTTAGGSTPSPGGLFLDVSGVVTLPTISGINVHHVTQNSVVPGVIISGGALAPPTAINFGPGITVNVDSSSSLALQVTLNVAPGAATGPRTFSVSTGAGTATSSAGIFSVDPALSPVTLLSLQPNLQLAGGTIDVHGTTIRDPLLAVGALAIGTNVVLRKGPNSKSALNVVARPDAAGHQVVRITIPDRSGTPWAKNEPVTLELTFTGGLGTGSLTFTYDDP